MKFFAATLLAFASAAMALPQNIGADSLTTSWALEFYQGGGCSGPSTFSVADNADYGCAPIGASESVWAVVSEYENYDFELTFYTDGECQNQLGGYASVVAPGAPQCIPPGTFQSFKIVGLW
jgi:hypothetical protein